MNSRAHKPGRSTLRTFVSPVLVGLMAVLLASIATSTNAHAENAAAVPGRNFYGVLDEVLNDFEYDVKNGLVLGLKDLSIRHVVTGENIPPSFKSHIELLVSERILKSSKTRIVHCLACRSKKATMNGDSMIISSADSNNAEMQRMAKVNGIQNFMDIAYDYQPTGMILSLQISDADTNTLLWSHNYNSESTRAAAQRKGIDFTDAKDTETKMEYSPTVQYKPTIYTVISPKAGSGSSTSLALGFRMMERYDNRKKEVGFEINSYLDVPSLVGSATAAEKRQNIYSGFNLSLMFVHAWGLFGEVENYNSVRGVIFGAVGGTYASGFLGGLIRGGYEWRLAKHWAISAFLGYRPKATVVISTGTTAALSGVEGGIGVGFIF